MVSTWMSEYLSVEMDAEVKIQKNHMTGETAQKKENDRREGREVVTAVQGPELIQFLAALAVLKKGMN